MTTTGRYHDRSEAGRILAAALGPHLAASAIVLALPRGGVPVAHEVAASHGLPLDIVLVRKLGVPWQEELALGAVTSHGVRVLDHDLIESLGLSQAEIEEATRRQLELLAQQRRAFRGDLPPIDAHGRQAVLIDDGFATGATMHAAILDARDAGAVQVIAAAPVGSEAAAMRLRRIADLVVCPALPPAFVSVGSWYDDFTQVADGEVRALLRAHAVAGPAGRPAPATAARHRRSQP